MKELEFWTRQLIKQIDFHRVADDEMEWCSDSRERMLSWARGAVEEAVTSGDEEEHRVGCFHSSAIHNGGKLIIDLEHRRTRQRATIEICEPTNQKKTNWDTVTPGDFAHFIQATHECYMCEACPASGDCDREMCPSGFLKWAYKEIKPEEATR
jgi:hypothetical protein